MPYYQNNRRYSQRNYPSRKAPPRGFPNLPVLPIVIIIAAIIFLKPLQSAGGLLTSLFDGIKNAGSRLFEILGISNTKADIKINQAISDPTSFWNPDFYKKAPAGSVLMTSAGSAQMIKDIKSCFGFFFDDFGKIFSLFKSLKTQSQVSFLAWRWQQIEKTDMLVYLKGEEWPQDRLSDEEIEQIEDYIKKLPKHKP